MTLRYECNGVGCKGVERASVRTGALPVGWTVRFEDGPEGRKALHYCPDCQDGAHNVKPSALGSAAEREPAARTQAPPKPKPKPKSLPPERTRRSKPKSGDEGPPSLF